MPRDPALLGCYVIPGPSAEPRTAVEQAAAAERLGLGATWLSELQGPFKDAATVCALMGAATERITVGTSVSHFVTRHPMIQAQWGATMQVVTGGRFQMGFGRSNAARWRAWGVANQTIEAMEDHAGILRRLWNGETVTYDGPAGSYHDLRLTDAGRPDLPPTATRDFVPPRLLLAAIGPRTLELAGRAFDGVLMYPALTPAAVSRARIIVREAAERAGRDPDDVVIHHQVVVAPDLEPADRELVVGARMAAYFMGRANTATVARMNGWSLPDLETFQAAAQAAIDAARRAGSELSGREALRAPGALIPPGWVESTTAQGTARECAGRLGDYLDAGADRVIVHGVDTEQLSAVVAAFQG